MSATLRPLRDDEYDAFVATTSRGYAGDMVRAGLAEDVAQAKAEQDFAALLTDRVQTPGHFLFAIEDGDSIAGYLWLAERRTELGHQMFVYAIELEPEFRGRGLGRAAMLLAEDETRVRGIPQISLNVFGGNDVARGLYRSLGYVETAIHMDKKL